MTARVLTPKPGLLHRDQNGASVVLEVQHGTVDFLLTVDIDSATETSILADGSAVAAEILKVAHHRSQSSSSPNFLNAVAPAEAIISVGANNTYGHPTESTLTRLYACGARVWPPLDNQSRSDDDMAHQPAWRADDDLCHLSIGAILAVHRLAQQTSLPRLDMPVPPRPSL